MLMTAMAIGLLIAQVAPAGSIITAVDRTRGTAGDRSPIGVFGPDTDPLPSNPLADGEIVFSDRDYPWINTPASMMGQEYVRTFNTDKHNRNLMVNYAVTISEPTQLWIAIDDRLPAEFTTDGGVQVFVSQQEIVDLIVHTWAAPGSFVDTGDDLIIDEGGGRPMSVYMSDELPAGTYDFGLDPTGKNFHLIGAVPEPMTMTLLGLGGLALVRRRRR
jgi:hypothetical protein